MPEMIQKFGLPTAIAAALMGLLLYTTRMAHEERESQFATIMDYVMDIRLECKR